MHDVKFSLSHVGFFIIAYIYIYTIGFSSIYARRLIYTRTCVFLPALYRKRKHVYFREVSKIVRAVLSVECVFQNFGNVPKDAEEKIKFTSRIHIYICVQREKKRGEYVCNRKYEEKEKRNIICFVLKNSA